MRSRSVLVLTVFTTILAAGMLVPTALEGQAATGQSRLREGLGHFRDGQYQQAVSSFRAVILESPQSDPAAPEKADAYYWIARSHMALSQLDEAEKNLEFFLRSYPGHGLVADALYQKGRLLFLQGEPENAILVFEEFMQRYPEEALVANALYWIGESLYSLGRLDEAAQAFETVVRRYPTSFKVTEAGYRLSLIEFKKRENELLKLLKWSHEETLRVVEEFQRREKAYEQAVSVYQRRLSAADQKVQVASGNDLEALRAENEGLRRSIAALETKLAGAGSTETDAAALYADLQNRQRLLQTKAEALSIKEALLEALSKGLTDQE